MDTRIRVLRCIAAAAMAVCTGAWAAPTTYSFTTGVRSGGSGAICAGGVPCSPQHPYYAFSSTATVSGTFVYDPAAPATSTSASGATVYGSYPVGGGFASSFSGLTGSVDGRSFADVRGFTTVGNETQKVSTGPTTFEMRDFFQLNSEPPLGDPNPHNITGFDIGDYSLVNVRLFWGEGQLAPELVPDLFSDQNLPAELPSFHGVLALDLVPLPTAAPGAFGAAVFFNTLSVARVPEPASFALLLTALSLLGWHASQRKLRRAAPRSRRFPIGNTAHAVVFPPTGRR